MVPLRLGEGTDPVGEGQRVGEAREVKTRSSRAMPSRSSSCQPETSRLSSAIFASVTRGESWRQATHRSADKVLIARTSPGALRARPGSRPRPRRGPAPAGATLHLRGEAVRRREADEVDDELRPS